MGEAQAIPDKLFDYSDQTTHANSDVATWIRNILTPAIQLYQETAIDLGDDIPDLTLQRPGPSGSSIDADVLTCLRQLMDTDQWVHDVGKAFEDAGNSTTAKVPAWIHNHLPPGQDPYQYATISTDDDDVDVQLAYVEMEKRNQQSFNQGAALASQVVNPPPITNPSMFNNGDWLADDTTVRILQTLSQHLGDPAFAEGFWSSLNQQQLILLINYYACEPDPNGDPTQPRQYSEALVISLVEAYQSGALGNDFTRMLLSSMQAHGRPMQLSHWFMTEFFKQLSEDPVAARNFFVTVDSKQLANVLLTTTMDNAETQAFLKAAAAAEQGYSDPGQAQTILDVASTALNSSTAQPSVVLPQIEGLLKAATDAEIQPPSPGMSPRQLADWATQAGDAETRILAPFDKWVKSTDNTDATTQAWTNFAASSLIGAMMIPFDPWVGFAIGSATGYVETFLEPVYNADLDSGNLRQAQADYMKSVIVIQLLAQGDLLDSNGKPVPVQSPEQINAIISDPDSWRNYQVKGSSDLTLEEMLNDAIGPILDQPAKKP